MFVRSVFARLVQLIGVTDLANTGFGEVQGRLQRQLHLATDLARKLFGNPDISLVQLTSSKTTLAALPALVRKQNC